MQGMLALLAAGRKLVLWSRTLCCCGEAGEGCKLRASSDSQRQGHRGRAGATRLSVCLHKAGYSTPPLGTGGQPCSSHSPRSKALPRRQHLWLCWAYASPLFQLGDRLGAVREALPSITSAAFLQEGRVGEFSSLLCSHWPGGRAQEPQDTDRAQQLGMAQSGHCSSQRVWYCGHLVCPHTPTQWMYAPTPCLSLSPGGWPSPRSC